VRLAGDRVQPHLHRSFVRRLLPLLIQRPRWRRSCPITTHKIRVAREGEKMNLPRALEMLKRTPAAAIQPAVPRKILRMLPGGWRGRRGPWGPKAT
jgi:hypothetical protein